MFENNVFQNLNVKGEVNYYQRKSGLEINFILNKKIAFEVKINPQKTNVKKLKKLSQELKLKKFKIISKNYSELKNVNYGFML